MSAGHALHYGQHHDDDNNIMSRGLPRCSTEVKGIKQLGVDEHISQMMDMTHVYKFILSDQMKEKGYECCVQQCQAKTAIHKKVGTTLSILTSDLSAPVARLHKSRLFVPVAVSVVFSLQTKYSRVQMVSSRDHLL